MKQDIQLKLQAYLDGELPPDESKAVVDLIASDLEMRGLLTELTNTRAAMVAHEVDVKVPATREFYWSGIRREIERQEKPSPKRQDTPIFAVLRRILVPAGGLAAVLVAVMLAGHQFGSAGGVLREETETTFDDAGAFTYRDYDSGTTLVWMDYPAENDFAQMDAFDILDFD